MTDKGLCVTDAAVTDHVELRCRLVASLSKQEQQQQLDALLKTFLKEFETD